MAVDILTLYLIEKPFTNRADWDQEALAWSGSTQFAIEIWYIVSYTTGPDNNLFALCTNMKVYLYNYS